MKKLLLGLSFLLAGIAVQAQTLRIFNSTPCSYQVTVYQAAPGSCGPPPTVWYTSVQTIAVPPLAGSYISVTGGGNEWRYATIVDDGALRCGPSGGCAGDLGTYVGVTGTPRTVWPHTNCVSVGGCNSTCSGGTYSLYYSQNFGSNGPTDIEIY